MKSHLFNARDTSHNKNEMKDNADKIDMKTNELKKMDGMEDISNFFSGPPTNNGGENEDGSQREEIDRKKLEIIKKLNLRVRD